MAGAIGSPYATRPLPVRLVAHVGGYARGMPVWLRAVFLVIGVGGALAVGYWALERQARVRAQAGEREGWRKFEEAARTGDFAAMDAALGEVLAAKPGDPIASARRAALKANSATENDPVMPRLTLRKALRANDMAAAKREAEKLLAHAPRDWLAHCVLAGAALSEGDRATAVAEVEKLTDPSNRESGVQPGVLLFAFDLHRRLGRDATDLRKFVQSNVANALKAETVKNLPPSDRLGVVECYLMGYEPGDALQPTPILEAFAPARDLVASAAADALAEADPVPALARAARLGPALELAAERFARRGQITPEQLAEFHADDRERTARLWAEVLARDPKSAEAYRNLAAAAARRGDGKAALELLVRGLAECPDDPALAEIQARVLADQGQGPEAAKRLAAEARQRPTAAVWWKIAVEAARRARRADLALELLKESRALRPGEPWTAVAEAEVRLAAGDAAAAADLLAPLGFEALAGDAGALPVAAEAFATAQRSAQGEALARAAEELAAKRDSPAPLVSLLAGLTAAPPTEAGLAAAAARAESARRRFPDAADLLRAVASCQFRRAELANWDGAAVNRAASAVSRTLAARADDREAAGWLGALRLYGENRPEQALRDLEPLSRAEAALGAGELELLGEAHRRAGRAEEAARLLRLAAGRPRPGAGVFTQLALAELAAGRAAAARAALSKAQALPRTPREQADYAAAAQTLYRETPAP